VYGTYRADFIFERQGVLLQIRKTTAGLAYERRENGSSARRVLPSSVKEIVIHPVEPVNLPKEITKYLEVQFDTVLIGPGERRTIYLTYPLEIGVFAASDEGNHVIDNFSFRSPKFSLYGPADAGVVCRWYRSRVYAEPPPTDSVADGVIELHLKNNCQAWVEVSDAIFEANGMVMYFDGSQVAMIAEMAVVSRIVAETRFVDRPLREGMTQAIELHKARGIPGVDFYAATRLPGVSRIPGIEKNGFLMEWGLR